MSTYRVQSHPVEVARIQSVQPLMGRNSVLTSPDFGLVLVLDGGTKRDWLCEKGSPAPTSGDWLVYDEALHVSYIVAASKFSELFRESKG